MIIVHSLMRDINAILSSFSHRNCDEFPLFQSLTFTCKTCFIHRFL